MQQKINWRLKAGLPQLSEKLGHIKIINTLDGLRITFENDDIIHFRPSGNAPEFRCYSESGSAANAQAINKAAMQGILQASS